MLRRRFLALCGSIAIAATVAACSSADEPEAAVSSAPGGAFPVSIDHEFGTTTIPAEPKRIVTLGVTDADVVIALGAVPVANAGFVPYQGADRGLGPWALEIVGDADIPSVAFTDVPDYELIASLQPDLISAVATGFEADVYENLAKIAPTIVRPKGTIAYNVPRAEQTLIIAEALGKKAEGETLNARTDELIAQAVADNPSFAGKTGVSIMIDGDEYWAFLPGNGRGQFLATLGFLVPPAVTAGADGESFSVMFSAERVQELDGDVILILGDDDNLDYDPAATNPLFASLKGYQDGGVVPVTLDERGAMTFNSVLSIPYALERVVPRIAAALS